MEKEIDGKLEHNAAIIEIETDLTAEEKADIAEGRKERREHPENFISLDEYAESRGLT